MGQLKVFFAGVCVFFEDYSQFISSIETPPVRRMVLIDGDRTSFVLGGQTISISPHLALLTLPRAGFVAAGELPPFVGTDSDGNPVYSLNAGTPNTAYTISIVNPQVTQGWINSAACLPHLAAFLQGALGPPSIAVIANDAQAACYVDFQYGLIEGFNQRTSSGALMGIARATVDTTENPQILIQGAGLETTVTFMNPDAVIAVTNKGEGTGDAPGDFLLNYLTCADQPPPGNVSIPPGVSCPPLDDAAAPDKFRNFEAGPGCSNTNFP